MNINLVSSGRRDLSVSAKPGGTVEAIIDSTMRPIDSGAAAAATPTRALREIVGRYDVTDISPNELSEMVQQLFEAGAISETELQQLAAIRLDLDASGLEADDSIDLLEYFAEKIVKLQRRFDEDDGPAAVGGQLAATLRRLDWVQKLASIQSGQGLAELDALV